MAVEACVSKKLPICGHVQARRSKTTLAFERNEDFRKNVLFGGWNWLFVITVTIVLVGVPAMFSFYVEFKSPKAGLGCRSFILLCYLWSQVSLTLLMVIDNKISSKTSHPRVRPEKWGMWKKCLYILGSLPFAVAIFTTVGGTLMEMIGVFQSCPCSVSILDYFRHKENAVLYVATDTPQFRAFAELWTICGYGALGVLSAMTYLACLIQRDLRTKFGELVDILKHEPQPLLDNTPPPQDNPQPLSDDTAAQEVAVPALRNEASTLQDESASSVSHSTGSC